MLGGCVLFNLRSFSPQREMFLCVAETKMMMEKFGVNLIWIENLKCEIKLIEENYLLWCLLVVAFLVVAAEHLVDPNILNFLLNLEILVHISHLVGLIMLILSCTCKRAKKSKFRQTNNGERKFICIALQVSVWNGQIITHKKAYRAKSEKHDFCAFITK